MVHMHVADAALYRAETSNRQSSERVTCSGVSSCSTMVLESVTLLIMPLP